MEDVGTEHGIAAHLPTRFDGSEGGQRQSVAPTRERQMSNALTKEDRALLEKSRARCSKKQVVCRSLTE